MAKEDKFYSKELDDSEFEIPEFSNDKEFEACVVPIGRDESESSEVPQKQIQE
jgi:hypothetical protein